MVLSLKKVLIASVLVQQSFGFWILNVDKSSPQNSGARLAIVSSGYNLPLLYNYEKKDMPWKSECVCGFASLFNQPVSQCQPGCDDVDPNVKMVLNSVDEKNELISSLEFGTNDFKPCGMIYDNYNFTTYVCGSEVNDQYAKSTKLYNQNQDVDSHTSDLWMVTVDDQASKYGYKNQLTIDYFLFKGIHIYNYYSKCLTSIDLPNDNLFDQIQDKDGITCDSKLYDPVTIKGVGNVLSSLENTSTKESYPCFFVEHKLRFSIYACGKQVPVLTGETTTTVTPTTTATTTTAITTTTTTTTTTVTKSNSSLKPTSTAAPKCTAGYCGKKRGNGPTGACCSSSDDCLDTCNSNGKCGVSDETGEPKTSCPA